MDDNEELYPSVVDPEGTLQHTNQSPFNEQEFFATTEDAYNKGLLDNHALRLSFIEHSVEQSTESQHARLQAMQPELAAGYELLNRGREYRMQITAAAAKGREAIVEKAKAARERKEELKRKEELGE